MKRLNFRKRDSAYFLTIQKCLADTNNKKTRLITTIEALGLLKGSHKLRVVVSDTCGNTTEWNWAFEVR